jgi:hypothetical protein
VSTARNTKPPHPAALLNEAIQRIVANPGTLDAELAALGRSLEAPDLSDQVTELFDELKDQQHEDALLKLAQAVLSNTNELAALRAQQRDMLARQTETLAVFKQMLVVMNADKELILDSAGKPIGVRAVTKDKAA